MLKVIKFGAEWCGPCRTLEPVFDRIASNTPGVEFVKIDIDKEPMMAQAMGVLAVPTLVFVKDGASVGTMVGLQKEAAIRNTIDKWK